MTRELTFLTGFLAGNKRSNEVGDNMQLTSTGEYILKQRYLKYKNGVLESPEELFHRVANSIAQAEKLFYKEKVDKVAEDFYQVMKNLDFLPNSPTLLNAGENNGQLAACFVLPLEDKMDKNFETLKKTAIIHSFSGGTGFSFSKIKPEGWWDGDKYSLGPIAYLKIFNYTSSIIKQGNVRAGANMATIAIHHPDILKFINCKTKDTALNNFNLSVAITDDFMDKLKKDQMFQLSFQGKNYSEIRAKELFRHLATSAWMNGEPGVIFIDHINRRNPTPEIESIETTNPCGEQPLLPYESCTLGSINLVKFVNEKSINWSRLSKIVEIAVRFLDNVIEVNKIPIKEIEEKTKLNRKIGIGVMGFANLLQIFQIPYNDKKAEQLAEELMSFINFHAHKASEKLGEERGSFPNIDKSIYKYKVMRNATCTTIAPTGTISSIAGVSSGIEPSFSMLFERTVGDTKTMEFNKFFYKFIENNYSRQQVKEIINRLKEKGTTSNLPHLTESEKQVFLTASEIDPIFHLRIQGNFQKFCDNAVAKTINLPETASINDVEKIFINAYKLKCKGVTIYRIGSRKVEALRFPIK